MAITVCKIARPEFEAVQYNGSADIQAIQKLSGFEQITLKGGVLSVINDDGATAHELKSSDWLLKPYDGSLPFIVSDEVFCRDYKRIRTRKAVKSE